MARKYPETQPRSTIFTIELFHVTESNSEIVDRYSIPFLVSRINQQKQEFKPLMLQNEALKIADRILHYLIAPTEAKAEALAKTIDLTTVQTWLGKLPPWFWCWIKNSDGQILTVRSSKGQHVIYQALFVSQNGVMVSALGEAIEVPSPKKPLGFGVAKQLLEAS